MEEDRIERQQREIVKEEEDRRRGQRRAHPFEDGGDGSPLRR
jgi:hypothetical protein